MKDTPLLTGQVQKVHVHGCVAWSAPSAQGFNLQDGAATAYVRLPRGVSPPAVDECVEVDGVLQRATYSNVVGGEKIRLTGERRSIAPVRRDLGQLAQGSETSLLVRAEGVVRDVRWNAMDNVAELMIDAGSVRVPVQMWNQNSLLPGRLPVHFVDARVAVTGVASISGSGPSQATLGVRIKTRSARDIQFLRKPPADPWQGPMHPPGVLFRYHTDGSYGHRIRMAGTIVFHDPGRLAVFSQGPYQMAAEVREGPRLARGDLVEVSGFPAVGHGVPFLAQAVYRVTGHADPPKPEEYSIDPAKPAPLIGKLVTAEAHYVGRFEAAGRWLLRFRVGAKPLIAHAAIDARGLDGAAEPFEPETLVRVTGVYWADINPMNDSPVREPVLLIQGIEDLRLLRNPPFLNGARLLYLFLALAACTCLGAIWTIALRLRVQAQTKLIRDRLEHEAVLEARFLDLFENSNDPIYCHDYSARITSWNPAAERVTGYHCSEVLGKPCGPIIAPEYFDFSRRLILSIREGKMPSRYKIGITAKDGRLVVLEVSSRRICAQGGPEIECVARDITERIKSEEDLEAARRRAEAATLAKSGFLANMSHEIRTPINGVLGMNQLLLESKLSPEQREWAEAVSVSAEALLSIVNDVLDISKIESGKLAIERQPFDLHEVLRQTVTLMAPRASESCLDLQFHFPEGAPRRFFGDQLRVRQVILNFLSNSVKFTPPGGSICVAVTVTPGRAALVSAAEAEGFGQRASVRIAVTDTGMGIPAAAQPSIFEKFTQADSSITRQFGGTGLGLAISKELCALMSGSIGFTSKEGAGSTFWMDVPLDVDRSEPFSSATATGQRMITAPPRLQPADRPRTKQDRHKILLVEDNRVNQKLLARMLENRNCSAIIVENGKQAVERFEADAFDMILMDCQMPVLDGYRATAAIRALEESLGVRTPIVALTANAMVGDREKCLAAGMDDYLSKPVHREELDNTLARWLTAPVER